jgi:hypothetical protein
MDIAIHAFNVIQCILLKLLKKKKKKKKKEACNITSLVIELAQMKHASVLGADSRLDIASASEKPIIF